MILAGFVWEGLTTKGTKIKKVKNKYANALCPS